ncbi:MAG TPA: zinc-ribbon domain-containing protein [Longimicrobiales bacterium]
MNLHCPSCQTVYRVDPERIPVSGVRARCSKCQAVFAVARDGRSGEPAAANATATNPVAAPAPPAPSAPPPAARPRAPAPTQAASPITPVPTTPAPMAPLAPRPAVMPAAPPAPAPAFPAPRAPVPPAPAAGTPSPAPAWSPAPSPVAPGVAAASTARAKPVFGMQDPDTRAQRIARALVSDMVIYNGDRRDQSLAAGTLKGDFREEILKSWEEYVAQVGAEMAKKTPHFRDALNAILAKGNPVF